MVLSTHQVVGRDGPREKINVEFSRVGEREKEGKKRRTKEAAGQPERKTHSCT